MHSSETIVFASHSESLLNSFCQRGIVLQSGVINFDGPIKEALDCATNSYCQLLGKCMENSREKIHIDVSV